MRTYRTRQSGFTLVEILIVVIILGILAAIVIPQFTNASEDARNNSATSQLQTLRSQIELYKLQHRETFPTADGTATGAWDWTKLTSKTDEAGAAGGILGPYMQVVPTNPRNSSSTVVVAADDTAAAAVATAGTGFIFSSATGKIFATDKNGAYMAD
jgi:type II secretion system protein G